MDPSVKALPGLEDLAKSRYINSRTVDADDNFIDSRARPQIYRVI